MSISKYQREQMLRRKHLCIICEKPAEPRGERGYWSKCSECREKAKKAKRAADEKSNKQKQSLCWFCRNAVPDDKGKQGCNWSRNKLPVDGWDAIPTKLKVAAHMTVPSYHVKTCPEFVEG